MARGFVCLTAVLDWFSRRALSWRVSITMEVDFCLEAVEEALARHGKPEIFNTGQGSQFTSATPINVNPWDQPAGEPLNGGVTLFRRTRPPLYPSTPRHAWHASHDGLVPGPISSE